MENSVLNKKISWTIWTIFGVFLLINIAIDWFSYNRISPLGVLLLVIYIGTSLLMPLLGLPIITTKGWKTRLVMMLLLLGGLITYLIFVIGADKLSYFFKGL